MSSLRADARAARRTFVATLNPVLRGALQQALARQLAPHLHAPLIGSYYAVGDEINPSPAVAGHRTAYPRVTAADAPLSFHICPASALQPGFRGIAEPPAHLPTAAPRLLLVPLVAADLAGHRIGQGGGHYDRTLAALRAQGPLTAIGVCWDVQLLPAIPPAPWDQPLDAIATPTRFHWCQAG